jgi:hypothetical protein
MTDLCDAIEEAEFFLRNTRHEEMRQMLQHRLQTLYQAQDAVTVRTTKTSKDVAPPERSRSNSDQCSSIAPESDINEKEFILNTSMDNANEWIDHPGIDEIEALMKKEEEEEEVPGEKVPEETLVFQPDESLGSDTSGQLNSTNRDVSGGQRHREKRFLTHTIIADVPNLRFSILVLLCSLIRAVTQFGKNCGDHVYPFVGFMQMILQAVSNRSFPEILKTLEKIASITFFEEDEEGRQGYQAFVDKLLDRPNLIDENAKSRLRMLYKRIKQTDIKNDIAEVKFYSEMAQSRIFMDYLEEICDDLIINAQRLKSVTVLRSDDTVTRAFPIGQNRNIGGEKSGNQALLALNTLLDLSKCIEDYQINRNMDSAVPFQSRKHLSAEKALIKFLKSISMQLSRGSKGESPIEHGVRYGLNAWLGDTGAAADNLCRLIKITLVDIARVQDLQQKLSELFRTIEGKSEVFTNFFVDYLDFQKTLYYLPTAATIKAGTDPNDVQAHVLATEWFKQGGFTSKLGNFYVNDEKLKRPVQKSGILVIRDDSVLVKQLPKYLLYLTFICPRVFELFYPKKNVLEAAATDYINMVVSKRFWTTDDKQDLVLRTKIELGRLAKGVFQEDYLLEKEKEEEEEEINIGYSRLL